MSYNQGTNTYTELVSDLITTSFKANGLTAGVTYKFKIEARNTYGYSTYSNEIAILCATVPSVPATPINSNALDQVVFDWTASAENGLSITSYTVLIRRSDNQFAEILDYCNGALASIVTFTECKIPLTTLTTSPFSLVFGDSIDFKV